MGWLDQTKIFLFCTRPTLVGGRDVSMTQTPSLQSNMGVNRTTSLHLGAEKLPSARTLKVGRGWLLRSTGLASRLQSDRESVEGAASLSRKATSKEPKGLGLLKCLQIYWFLHQIPNHIVLGDQILISRSEMLLQVLCNVCVLSLSSSRKPLTASLAVLMTGISVYINKAAAWVFLRSCTGTNPPH